MMTTQRHFTMSALSATIAIRLYLNNHPEVDSQTATVSLRRYDADIAANDFEAGLEIHNILSNGITFKNPTADLRASLSELIDHHQPLWLRGFPYGRDRVIRMLSDEESQCFRTAGLLDEPAPDEVVQWWDRFSEMVRARMGDQLLRQGREAELLSLNHERQRLASLGIPREPVWVAINNNGAGYDILSFSPGPMGPINRLIEVKSSTREPPQIVLTRNEWEAAVQYGNAYIFHVWALPAKTLTEISVPRLAKHVPLDQGDGLWCQVEIPISQ
jgi:Domain of unknown function (DUF3883)